MLKQTEQNSSTQFCKKKYEHELKLSLKIFSNMAYFGLLKTTGRFSKARSMQNCLRGLGPQIQEIVQQRGSSPCAPFEISTGCHFILKIILFKLSMDLKQFEYFFSTIDQLSRCQQMLSCSDNGWETLSQHEFCNITIGYNQVPNFSIQFIKLTWKFCCLHWKLVVVFCGVVVFYSSLLMNFDDF